MYILLAVDGTFSATHYNTGTNRSFVRRFFDRFSGGYKVFFEGPASAPGFDVDNIIRRADRAIRQAIRHGASEPELKICLVGHSRGGHIVTDIAMRLNRLRLPDVLPGAGRPSPRPPTGTRLLVHDPLSAPMLHAQVAHRASNANDSTPTLRVHFMGLYDSVDMTWNGGDTMTIPPNIDWYAHAMRDPAIGSRSSWGNTSNDILCSERHRTRFFAGTHGALGGAPAEHCSAEWAVVADQCRLNLRAGDNAAAGRRAHDFILDHARAAQVPI
ncbi:MAG: hypothetical protein P8R43_01010 [Planctomycetota bacterium]|nr:hypothetical protein [Planctomycetota bacterium]